MSNIQDIEARRSAVWAEVHAIRSMKRATVSEQFLKVHQKGKPEPALRGPYYVLSWKEDGRTVSKRLTSPEELEQARRDIAAYKRFVALCREYEALTEQLGELERQSTDGDQKKKRRRSPSNKMRK